MTNPFICPQCHANVLKVGFVARTIKYQAFLPQAGQLWRSHTSKADLETTHCLPCGTQLEFTAEQIREAE